MPSNTYRKYQKITLLLVAPSETHAGGLWDGVIAQCWNFGQVPQGSGLQRFPTRFLSYSEFGIWNGPEEIYRIHHTCIVAFGLNRVAFSSGLFGFYWPLPFTGHG